MVTIDVSVTVCAHTAVPTGGEDGGFCASAEREKTIGKIDATPRGNGAAGSGGGVSDWPAD